MSLVKGNRRLANLQTLGRSAKQHPSLPGYYIRVLGRGEFGKDFGYERAGNGYQRESVHRAGSQVAGFWNAFSNRHTRPTQRMIKEMPNIKDLLSGLRQEISDLQNMNARYAGKRVHSEVEQTALELRTTRLREIKQELSKMLDRPQDAKVWWEKSRRSSGVAIAE